MLTKQTRICVLAATMMASLIPNSAQADQIDLTDPSALRAFFQTPFFQTICPLTNYGGDYSTEDDRLAWRFSHRTQTAAAKTTSFTAHSGGEEARAAQ